MDIVNHALDAPLANVLIVAGILFLGVAAVGKVSGKLEPTMTGRVLLGVFGIVFFAFGLYSHSAGHTDEPDSRVAARTAPTIQSFRAATPAIDPGDGTVLSWAVADADTVSIAPDIGSVPLTGERPVAPTATTVFELTATSDGGTRTVTTLVQVGDSQPVQARPPTIALFQATPDLLDAGGASVISWRVENADSVTIDPELGGVALEGSRTLTLDRDTAFRLAATNSAGRNDAALTVQVRDTAPTESAPAPGPPPPNRVAVALRDGFELRFDGREAQTVRGNDFVRFNLSVPRWSAVPAELFEPAPDLPPCGRNLNSSRTWVNIVSDEGNRLYGYCALTAPDQLERLSFAVRQERQPPDAVYVELQDRRTGETYRSSPVALR